MFPYTYTAHTQNIYIFSALFSNISQLPFTTLQTTTRGFILYLRDENVKNIYIFSICVYTAPPTSPLCMCCCPFAFGYAHTLLLRYCYDFVHKRTMDGRASAHTLSFAPNSAIIMIKPSFNKFSAQHSQSLCLLACWEMRERRDFLFFFVDSFVDVRVEEFTNLLLS